MEARIATGLSTNNRKSRLLLSPSKSQSLFTTWARFPLFSQGIKFNIPRSLIVTGEGGAETIAKQYNIYFSPGE